MIREFAVEPALLGDWNEFRYLHEKFGFSKARLIAEFPKKWRAMVYASASTFTPAQKKKLELWLKKKESFLVRSGREYTSDNWLLSAEAADREEGQAFHAILADENPRNHTKVIIPYDEPIEDHPQFFCPRECFMPRTPQGFIDVCRVTLKNARHIILVDPKFNGAGRWGQSVKALFGGIRRDIPVATTLYTSVTSLESECHRIGDIKEFNGYIPTGCKLEIVLLEYDNRKDHNRLLLTESCGIKFPWGLDTGSGSEDLVNLLDEGTHKTAYQEYTNLPGRTVMQKFTLEGRA